MIYHGEKGTNGLNAISSRIIELYFMKTRVHLHLTHFVTGSDESNATSVRFADWNRMVNDARATQLRMSMI